MIRTLFRKLFQEERLASPHLSKGLVIGLLLLALIQGHSVKAQKTENSNAIQLTAFPLTGKDLVSPCTNCVAEDIKLVDFFFKGYGPGEAS